MNKQYEHEIIDLKFDYGHDARTSLRRCTEHQGSRHRYR